MLLENVRSEFWLARGAVYARFMGRLSALATVLRRPAMRLLPPRILRKTLLRAAVGTLALALLTFAAFRLRMDLTSAMPLYMLLVVTQSMTGDFWSAAAVSILSAACLDFFFT